jgi:negative regulator of sigma E activity
MPEKISRLLDGQLEPGNLEQVLRDLAADPVSRDRFTLYTLLGDVLRGNSTPDDGYTLRLLDRLRQAGVRIEPGYDPLSD